MKKDYVYLSFIVVLFILFFAQSGSNQPSYSPQYLDQNEIGRFQYFTDPDGSIQGFLDTKEGLVFTFVGSEDILMWRDLKEKFNSHFFHEIFKDLHKIEASIGVTEEDKVKYKREREMEFDNMRKRIW